VAYFGVTTMNLTAFRWALCLALLSSVLLGNTPVLAALTKGIYLTQSTLENTSRLNYLIERSKRVGINTFVIDLERPSQRYQQNIQLIKNNDIHYVARIVIFPNGGTREQVKSQRHWEKKYELMKQAVAYGAYQIQIDYIRYNTKQRPSSQNAKDIHQIIQWYKEKLAAQNVGLQVDVFGETSFGESKYIGQNIKLFAGSIDVLCPMVYPSHYVPFAQHFAAPYETVYKSLRSIKEQFKDQPLPFKLNPYIELSNYHYGLSQHKKMDYIFAQIRAVQNAGADGWFAWSPHNQYDSLFHVMETYPVQ
jgi:hypothetical protein